MKILTKLLNGLFIIVFILGIAAIIYVIYDYTHRNDYTDKDAKIDSLTTVVVNRGVEIRHLKYELETVTENNQKHRELWLAERNIVNRLKEEKKHQKEVKNIPIDEMLAYIVDYFNSDGARLVQEGDSIYVIMTPKLVDDIGITIAEHRDNLDLLEAYEIQISLSDSLISGLTDEITSLRHILSLQDSSIIDLQNREEMYKQTLAHKEQHIKRLKFQRTIIGVSGVVVIVLLAL